MKMTRNILILSMALLFAVACEQGIDPITQVNPGPDATAPVIKIIAPEIGRAHV